MVSLIVSQLKMDHEVMQVIEAIAEEKLESDNEEATIHVINECIDESLFKLSLNGKINKDQYLEVVKQIRIYWEI